MTRMASPARVFFSLLVLLTGVNQGCSELALVETVAAEELPIPDRPIDKLSLSDPFWRRGAGLVYGAMALNNENSYSVKDVIISCDFFDEWGNLIGRRATGIRRIFGSGRSWISGVYLTLPSRNAQAGACRIISAKRVPAALVS
jgi:hypothetical protein